MTFGSGDGVWESPTVRASSRHSCWGSPPTSPSRQSSASLVGVLACPYSVAWSGTSARSLRRARGGDSHSGSCSSSSSLSCGSSSSCGSPTRLQAPPHHPRSQSPRTHVRRRPDERRTSQRTALSGSRVPTARIRSKCRFQATRPALNLSQSTSGWITLSSTAARVRHAGRDGGCRRWCCSTSSSGRSWPLPERRSLTVRGERGWRLNSRSIRNQVASTVASSVRGSCPRIAWSDSLSPIAQAARVDGQRLIQPAGAMRSACARTSCKKGQDASLIQSRHGNWPLSGTLAHPAKPSSNRGFHTGQQNATWRHSRCTS